MQSRAEVGNPPSSWDVPRQKCSQKAKRSHVSIAAPHTPGLGMLLLEGDSLEACPMHMDAPATTLDVCRSQQRAGPLALLWPLHCPELRWSKWCHVQPGSKEGAWHGRDHPWLWDGAAPAAGSEELPGAVGNKPPLQLAFRPCPGLQQQVRKPLLRNSCKVVFLAQLKA